MRKINNVMFLFAVIIYGFLIFSKHDPHDRVTKLKIIQVDNLKGTVKSPKQARVSILIYLIKHLQDSHFPELNNSETSNTTEKSELNQEKEDIDFMTKKVTVIGFCEVVN